jgi:hypothetical protein
VDVIRDREKRTDFFAKVILLGLLQEIAAELPSLQLRALLRKKLVITCRLSALQVIDLLEKPLGVIRLRRGQRS